MDYNLITIIITVGALILLSVFLTLKLFFTTEEDTDTLEGHYKIKVKKLSASDALSLSYELDNFLEQEMIDEDSLLAIDFVHDTLVFVTYKDYSNN